MLRHCATGHDRRRVGPRLASRLEIGPCLSLAVLLLVVLLPAFPPQLPALPRETGGPTCRLIDCPPPPFISLCSFDVMSMADLASCPALPECMLQQQKAYGQADSSVAGAG